MTDSVARTKFVVKMAPSLFIKKGDTKWRGTTFIVKTNHPKMGTYEVFFDWELTQDGALPTGIHLVSKTGSRVSSDLFRGGIPLKELLDRDVVAQAETRKQAPETIKFVAKNLGKTKGLELSSTPVAQLKGIKKRNLSEGKQVIEIEQYMVARAWEENQKSHATESAEKYIAKRTGLSKSVIRTRIYQCRKAGLIPPSTHGNATVNRPIKKKKRKKK